MCQDHKKKIISKKKSDINIETTDASLKEILTAEDTDSKNTVLKQTHINSYKRLYEIKDRSIPLWVEKIVRLAGFATVIGLLYLFGHQIASR